MIRAVIFDFNGVLVDDEMVHFALFREVLGEQGIELTEQQYHAEYLGYDDRGCFEVALSRAGRPADRLRVDALIAQKAGRYEALAAEGLSFFAGAREALASISRRWPVAICSGALRPEIEYALMRLDLRDRVGPILSAEDTTRCKPDPEGYQLALAALRSLPGANLKGLQPSECLVIEDSLAGIESARAAGMRAVGVPHTYRPDELRSAGAEAVLASLAELTPQWVDHTFGPPPEGSP